jgi:hypothetical protein
MLRPELIFLHSANGGGCDGRDCAKLQSEDDARPYPNTAIIIFYVLGSAIVALVMYRYHRSQI